MPNNNKGYTLIELAVVVLLIGLMLTFAVPRVRDTLLEDGLKTAARQLTGAVEELRYDAVREQVDYVLQLDLDKKEYWRYSVDMTPEKKNEMKERAVRFPDGIKITDVYHIGEEKKSDGEAQVRFFKQGYTQPTVIHLLKGERYFTLVINPFMAGVEVHEGYVDLEKQVSS
jgi:prepilin-type N-terminal cleavage/methylation domain-containing protein